MDSDYYRLLSDRILGILKLQPLELCDVIKESLGAYPDDVLICIKALIEKESIFIDSNVYYVSNYDYPLRKIKSTKKEVVKDLSWIKEITAKLSKPHPADYDWRFTNQTIFDLAQLVSDHKNRNTSVALFGTTTLFPIIKLVSPEIKLSLFNKSQSLIEDLEKMGFSDDLYVQDLFSKIPYSARYNLVIADPPWYNDFYNAFICRASEILDVGGYLYLSVLSILTRPDAEKDRAYIDQCCEQNGFEKIEEKTGFLSYESPIFEKRSLIGQDLKCSDWRKGDLVVYKKNRESEFSGSISTPVDEPLWEEYIINGLKLKILKDDDNENTFSFEYSDKSRLLSTVSRRSPIRSRIKFWTSENFAFNITKLEVLRYLFRFATMHDSLELALQQTKIYGKLTEDEYNSLVNLLKIANIIHSG